MPNADFVTDELGQAWFQYLRTSRLLEQALHAELRAAGLTHPDFEILFRLSRAPEQRMRMRDLSELVTAPKSRLTYQITQLENRGYLRRERFTGDGRVIHAVITSQGIAVVQQAGPAHYEWVREHVLDRLSPRELLELGRMMRILADGLES